MLQSCLAWGGCPSLLLPGSLQVDPEEYKQFQEQIKGTPAGGASGGQARIKSSS